MRALGTTDARSVPDGRQLRRTLGALGRSPYDGRSVRAGRSPYEGRSVRARTVTVRRTLAALTVRRPAGGCTAVAVARALECARCASPPERSPYDGRSVTMHRGRRTTDARYEPAIAVRATLAAAVAVTVRRDGRSMHRGRCGHCTTGARYEAPRSEVVLRSPYDGRPVEAPRSLRSPYEGRRCDAPRSTYDIAVAVRRATRRGSPEALRSPYDGRPVEAPRSLRSPYDGTTRRGTTVVAVAVGGALAAVAVVALPRRGRRTRLPVGALAAVRGR